MIKRFKEKKIIYDFEFLDLMILFIKVKYLNILNWLEINVIICICIVKRFEI